MNLDETAGQLEVLKKILKENDGVLNELNIGIDFNERRIRILVYSTDEGRKAAGKFVMAGYEMKVRKPWSEATYLQAIFKLDNGWHFLVDEYKPKTCKIVRKTRWVEAEEAQPAVERHEEEYTELVCDGAKVS